ncbi:pyridoxal phosphate-dependent aminotransferase [Deinococcus arboris]|uniref:pyridoxal phosphate-dependent aminotransferase n=1 Tax=Deinococcus arboris TaxID=2682977 RepID=UPI0034E289A2
MTRLTPAALPPLLPRAAHGGPGQVPFSGLDFSVNSNPFGPNPALLQAVRDADRTQYPDPTYHAVREALAAWHGTTPAQVALSTGASDLLHRCVRALVPPGAAVLSLHAPFGELARAVALARSPLSVLDDLTRPWPADTALLYVGQPHNPTGRILPASAWPLVLRRAEEQGTLIVVDEAYAPFTTLDPPPAHPQVLRLLSPGKAHGLVGARPAYALASADLCARLDNLAPAWHLSAGTAALLERLPGASAFLDETLPQVQAGAAQLAGQLRALGEVEHHGTPFLTLRVGEAAAVTSQLWARGIKVRDCASYGLPGCIRVSTRPPEQNAALVAALRAVLAPAESSQALGGETHE